MDRFVDALAQQGQADSEGAFSLESRRAFELLRDRRALDLSFPYWKFLQGCCSLGARSVELRLFRSGVCLQAYSSQRPPDLDHICDGLPEGWSALEAFRSAALAVRSDEGGSGGWCFQAKEEDENKIKELQNGVYQDSSKRPSWLPAWPSKKDSPFRLVMAHRWGKKGSFFAQLSQLLQRRVQVSTELQKRASFYPIPLLSGGRSLQSPLLDDQVKDRVLYSGLPSFRPGILTYRLTSDAQLQRFLTEPFCGRYRTVLEGSKVTRHQEPKFPRGCVVSVLQLKTSAQEPPGQGAFPLPLSVAFRGIQGTGYLTGSAQPLYCREAVFLPRYARAPGRLDILDRGIVLESFEIDLGLPGAIVLTERGRLKVDLQGLIVRDEQWEDHCARARELVREAIAAALPHVQKEEEFVKFLLENGF